MTTTPGPADGERLSGDTLDAPSGPSLGDTPRRSVRRLRRILATGLLAVAVSGVAALLFLRPSGGTGLTAGCPEFEARTADGPVNYDQRWLDCVAHNIKAALSDNDPLVVQAQLQDLADGDKLPVTSADGGPSAYIERSGVPNGRARFGLACHTLAHDLGWLMVDRNGTEALDDLRYFCLGGTVHGAMFAIGSKYEPAEAAELLEGYCDRWPDIAVVRYDCVHGIGHALAEPQWRTVGEALSRCDLLFPVGSPLGLTAGDGGDRYVCASGAMSSVSQRINVSIREGNTQFKLFGLCEGLDDAYARACWERVAEIAAASGRKPLELKSSCIGSGTYLNDCAYGVGWALAPLGRPAEKVSVCAASFGENSEGVERCVTGLLVGTVTDIELGARHGTVCPTDSTTAARWCETEFERLRLRELSPEETRRPILPAPARQN